MPRYVEGNSVQLDTKFYDYSMLLVLVFFVFRFPKRDIDFGKVQVMECPRHLLKK